MYPNPSINEFTVDGNFTSPVNYSILDINGRTILKGQLANNTIKHNLGSGMYLLQLNFENTRINFPLPYNVWLAGMMAIWYYVIWKLQKSYPNFFQDNIWLYIDRINKSWFWKWLSVIVE